MITDVFLVVMLLGALQGIIFSFVALLSKKYRSKSTIFLVLLILGFALNNLQYYFWEIGVIDGNFFFAYIYFPFAPLNMVFHFFYVKLFLYPNDPITPKQKFLFLPFIVFFIGALYYKIANVTGTLSDGTIVLFQKLIYVHEVVSAIYSLILLFSSYLLILKFEKTQISGKTQIPKINLKWLKIISFIAFLLCIFWIIAIADELKYGSEDATIFYVLWVGMSVTIYILGHVGLYRFGVLQEQKNIQKFASTSNPQINVGNEHSKNEYIVALENFIVTDKNYLDSSLSLDMVADKLKLNKSYLSRLINTELGKNFSDYVNELRVEEAKSYIENPEFRHYTLVSIGLEAGFNSKSAFNLAFKKFTGLTPSEYKKNLM